MGLDCGVENKSINLIDWNCSGQYFLIDQNTVFYFSKWG